MARKSKPFYFAVSEQQINECPQRLVLDMIRYDQVKVVECYAGFWIFEQEEHPPTSARWSSMRLTPLCLPYSRGATIVSRDRYELHGEIDAFNACSDPRRSRPLRA